MLIIITILSGDPMHYPTIFKASKLSKSLKLTLISSIVASLTACGGGGSGSTSEVESDTTPATPAPESVIEISLQDENLSDINGAIDNSNLANLLDNDTAASKAINLTDFSLTVVSKDDEIILTNNSLGLIANVQAGDYQLTYKVCENAKPDNCAQATATIEVNQGQFMGGVAGVRYVSNSAEGVTDASGGFIYQQGDNVQFFIGQSALGESVAADVHVNASDLISGLNIPVDAVSVNKFLNANGVRGVAFDEYPLVSEFLNILTTIYSLDADKNLDNGVAINEDVNQLLVDSTINFKTSGYDFKNNAIKARLLYAAYNDELIVNAEQINQYRALDHFALTNNLQPEVYVKSSEFGHEELDVIEEEYRTVFDAQTNRVDTQYFEIEGEDLAETPLESEVYVYDYNGNQTEFYYYDELELASSQQHIINIHGNTTQTLYKSDDIVKSKRDYQYNDFGFQIALLEDYDADGETDSFQFWQFDDNGNTILAEEGRNPNVDEKHIYIFNDSNQKIKEFHYQANQADKTQYQLDYIVFNFYDENGLLIRVENDDDPVAYYDEYNIDLIDTIHWYEYDENGNEINRKSDYYMDVEGYDNDYTQTYENGLVVSAFIYSNNSEIFSHGSKFEYDENGNKVTEHYYGSTLETPTTTNIYKYDENGLITERALYRGGSSDVDSITLYENDDKGNLVSDHYYNRGDQETGTYRYGSSFTYNKANFMTWYFINK